MAISSGVGPHAAWLVVNGTTLPIEHGSVSQHGQRESSTFSGALAMSSPGVRSTMAGLVGGNQAQITVMARGEMSSPLITGEIDNVDFDYLGRLVRFTGRDKSSPLHETKSSKSWVNHKGSDIVSDCIGQIGLSGNITPSPVKAGKNLQTDYVELSDLDTLAEVIDKCAEVDGYRWFVDPNGVFNYLPLGSQSGIYTITIDQAADPIAADCFSLHVKHNLQAGKTISTTVKSWHPRKRQVFQHTSNVAGSGGTKTYSYSVPTLLQGDAIQRAKARSTEIARHEFVVEAEVVGDPAVQAGMGLSVSGTDFDQAFDIDSVNHEFGMSGYTTSITARSAKEGRGTAT